MKHERCKKSPIDTQRQVTARHGAAQRSEAQHTTAQHRTVWHSTLRHGTAQHCTEKRSTACTALHTTPGILRRVLDDQGLRRRRRQGPGAEGPAPREVALLEALRAPVAQRANGAVRLLAEALMKLSVTVSGTASSSDTSAGAVGGRYSVFLRTEPLLDWFQRLKLHNTALSTDRAMAPQA